MNTKLNITITAILLASMISGCDFSRDNPTAPPPPEVVPAPTPYAVTAAGVCSAAGTTVQCTDRSGCIHATMDDVCQSILWTIRSSTTGQGNNSELGGHLSTVRFDALAPDTYSVEQKATAPDGVTNVSQHGPLKIE